ncbi:RICIN domain-containing protein [Micromonospora sp. CPCC 206061]|uniref:RICIN domain-containing protein n=1 Tax=Micromonospora sp. CPCC 206061 TaxID=3122410 RepID=UPI002FF12D95
MRNNSSRRLLAALVTAAASLAAMVSTVGGGASPAAAAPGGLAGAPPVSCVDDGTSGHRIQWLYAYEPGTSRFAEREAGIRAAAWVVERNVNDSARRDGAERRLRYHTSRNRYGECHVTIQQVQIPTGMTNTGVWKETLRSLGYAAGNRIYMVVSENFRSCAGVDNDNVGNDSTPSTNNLYNQRAIWATFEPACFNGHTVTHEFAHALGGVLPNAPNFVGGGHCSDGNETLCQVDAPTACPDPLAVRLLDCNRDDYFAVNPQGSYLPTHFNAALHSLYLQHGASVPAMTTIPPLAPQNLRATDVEGSSIALSFLPSISPTGGSFSEDFQLLRDGAVVATIPAWRPTVRVTGLSPGSTATYTVRHRVTVGGTVRTSEESRPLTVTTNSGTAPAGAAEAGAVLMFSNDLVDGNGANMAMDLYSFSENDGANIVNWPGNGKINQQWRVAATAPGSTHYTLTSQHSLKCVAIEGGAAVAGAFVVQQTCNGAQSQRWTFAVQSDVTYQIRPVGSANLCVQSNGTWTGARLALGTCSTTEPSQRWTANRIA